MEDRLSWYDIEETVLTPKATELLSDYLECWCMRFNSPELICALEKWFRINCVTINDLGQVRIWDDAGDAREFGIGELFRFVVGSGQRDFEIDIDIFLSTLLNRFMRQWIDDNSERVGFRQMLADYLQINQKSLVIKFGKVMYGAFGKESYSARELMGFVAKRFKAQYM